MVGKKIPVLILNLERDVGRRADILKQFKDMPNFEPRILAAVDGQTLPDSACLILTESESWLANKGTIGCFLSHARAWQEIAKMEEPFAVVLEDDAEIVDLNLITVAQIPADAEFIFLNERMSVNWYDVDFQITNLIDSLVCKDLDQKRPGNIDRNSFGTDGYFLTPKAAAKLIDVCKTDLFFGHVDGRLLRYATDTKDLENLPDESWVKRIISNHHNLQRMPKLGLLKGYAVSKPLVKHRNIPSSRAKADASS